MAQFLAWVALDGLVRAQDVLLASSSCLRTSASCGRSRSVTLICCDCDDEDMARVQDSSRTGERNAFKRF